MEISQGFFRQGISSCLKDFNFDSWLQVRLKSLCYQHLIDWQLTEIGKGYKIGDRNRWQEIPLNEWENIKEDTRKGD